LKKYERGANRVGASRLFQLSGILDVPVSYFYDEMSDAVQNIERNDQELEGHKSDPLSRRETLELVRAYYRIDNLRVRKRIFELVKSVARLNADD
jgi:transcriptional regulator with XRE-family HTH domain